MFATMETNRKIGIPMRLMSTIALYSGTIANRSNMWQP